MLGRCVAQSAEEITIFHLIILSVVTGVWMYIIGVNNMAMMIIRTKMRLPRLRCRSV